MRALLAALCLLALSQEAQAQEDHIVGSRCWRTVVHDDVLFDTACQPIYFPQGEFPPTNPLIEELPWTHLGKKDRLVPLRAITAEAAPK